MCCHKMDSFIEKEAELGGLLSDQKECWPQTSTFHGQGGSLWTEGQMSVLVSGSQSMSPEQQQ